MDRQRGVRDERPGGRRPHQDPSNSVAAAVPRRRVTPLIVRRATLVDLERHVHARILHLLVALRDFVARQRRLTPRAIRQNLVTAIQESDKAIREALAQINPKLGQADAKTLAKEMNRLVDEGKTLKELSKALADAKLLKGKAVNKLKLQQELGLPVDVTVPVFASIGRLVEQKGVDILLTVLPEMLAAKLQLQELQGMAADRAKEAARATDDFVHDHPWQVVGIAAAIGFVAGLLMNRR